MPSPLDEIFSRVILPDSLEERKKLLRAFKTVMKRTHPAYWSVRQQIRAIEQLERLQKELPLKFMEDK